MGEPDLDAHLECLKGSCFHIRVRHPAGEQDGTAAGDGADEAQARGRAPRHRCDRATEGPVLHAATAAHLFGKETDTTYF